MKNTLLFQKLTNNMRSKLTDIEQLCQAIAYEFSDWELLIEALTHSSAAQELLRRSQGQISIPWNERLEFLGDSVLGLVLSTHLLNASQRYTEGHLSKMRAALVNEGSLADLSLHISLGQYLILSPGEEKGGGRTKPSVLADALEALLGAIYLDGGFSRAERVILKLYNDKLSLPLDSLIQKDYKSRLQELTQGEYKEAPNYEVTGVYGPDHDISFQVSVSFRGRTLGKGMGPSKKTASQNAAKNALKTVIETPQILTEGMA